MLHPWLSTILTMGSSCSRCRLGGSLDWQEMYPVASQTAFRPQTNWICHTHLSDWPEINGTTLARMAFYGPGKGRIFVHCVLERFENRSYSGIMHPADTAGTALDINLPVGLISSAVASKLKFSLRLIRALLLVVHDEITWYVNSLNRHARLQYLEPISGSFQCFRCLHLDIRKREKNHKTTDGSPQSEIIPWANHVNKVYKGYKYMWNFP